MQIYIKNFITNIVVIAQQHPNLDDEDWNEMQGTVQFSGSDSLESKILGEKNLRSRIVLSNFSSFALIYMGLMLTQFSFEFIRAPDQPITQFSQRVRPFNLMPFTKGNNTIQVVQHI